VFVFSIKTKILLTVAIDNNYCENNLNQFNPGMDCGQPSERVVMAK